MRPHRTNHRLRAGFRTLGAASESVCLAVYSKNVRSNIDKDEEEALKKLASHLLSLCRRV